MNPTSKSNLPPDLLQQRTRELQTLVQVTQLVNNIDLEFVLSQILKLTTEVLGASKGSLFLLNADHKPYQRFISQRNLPPEVSYQVAQEVITHGLAGWCIRNRTGAIVEDVATDSRWYTFADDEQRDVYSALCVPILYENAVDGFMTLVSPERGFFDEADLSLAGAVANQASTALRNARLFDELQTKQSELELVLQNTLEALLTLDSSYRIRLINLAARQLLKNPPDGPLTGYALSDFSQGTPYEQILGYLESATKPFNRLTFEIQDEAKQQDYIVNISGLAHATEQPNGYIISLHHVTAIKEMERLRTQTLYVLTHDLRNPINIIWGYLDLLRIDSEQQLPADPRFVEGTLKAVTRMENLIEETLTTERLMATGQLRPQKIFSPWPIIREAIDDLQLMANQKKQTIREDLQPNIANVVGDPFQLREVMGNLISNAIKYTPEGGEITIHASSNAEQFTFSVKDNGMGIPQELQPKLFTEFYRAQRPQTKNIAGTGLGLSLVKKIIERHGGRVWYESREDVGSTFGFWLPLP